MSSGEYPVVLVTGGCGFVGQHIVKLLNQETNVSEIRIFDVRAFERTLDYTITKRMRSFLGDIRNVSDIISAVDGVDYVIHVAGLISVGNFPDEIGLEEINRQGTENLLTACIDAGVRGVVFTSTIDVVLGTGTDDLQEADESLPLPDNFLFGSYARTKSAAEMMIKMANGTMLPNGGQFHSLSLRSPTVYGEGDRVYISAAVNIAETCRGTLIRNCPIEKKQEVAYVGNVAWAHIKAFETLASGKDVRGKAYFVTDDTREKNLSCCANRFLQERGYRVTKFAIPYIVQFCILWITELLLWIIKPICTINMPCTVRSINHFYTNSTFSRKSAEQELNYKPLFSPQDSHNLSMAYYKNI